VANPVFKSIIHNILENPFDLNHKTPAENRSIKDIRAISGPRSARPGKVFEKVAIDVIHVIDWFSTPNY
jgi:hypothetical protein